jgi:hypothetical protein
MGLITATQLHEAMTVQLNEDLHGMEHRLIGQILLEREYTTSAQTREVLRQMGLPTRFCLSGHDVSIYSQKAERVTESGKGRFLSTTTPNFGEAMKHDIFFVDDESMFDSMQISKNHYCDICRKKGSFEQIQMHHSFYMCARCKHWYDLLPGVLIQSLRRFITGNVS